MTVPDEYYAACVQFDVASGDVAANVASMQKGIADAVAAGARLCVLPELWSTSFLTDFDDALLRHVREADEALRKLSDEHSLVVVGSTLETENDQVFNTARVYQRGEALASYRKIHTSSANLEHRHHTAGDQACLVDTELGKLGVMISYDIRFPELSRHYFHQGAEILTVPSQWPEARAQHWRTLLRARAIENELFVIGCNRIGQQPSLRNEEPVSYPGDGRIIDPTGEILANGNGNAEPIVAPIELRKVRTMRRILPVTTDLRPEVYKQLLDDAYNNMVAASRRRQGRPSVDEHS